jgi:hypothetical protein
MSTKLILRVPTFGKQAGDEINVADTETAEELVQNGTARRPSTSGKQQQSSKG